MRDLINKVVEFTNKKDPNGVLFLFENLGLSGRTNTTEQVLCQLIYGGPKAQYKFFDLFQRNAEAVTPDEMREILTVRNFSATDFDDSIDGIKKIAQMNPRDFVDAFQETINETSGKMQTTGISGPPEENITGGSETQQDNPRSGQKKTTSQSDPEAEGGLLSKLPKLTRKRNLDYLIYAMLTALFVWAAVKTLK